jgi:hypothetical protein
VQNREGEGSKVKKIAEMRIPLSRIEIAKVKARALRRGVWYRAITRVERACIDLVIRLVERVRSYLLGKMVSSVLKKLDEAMESRVQRLMREIGGGLASELSQIAQDWGNQSAVQWADDSGFIKYLTVACINSPFGRRAG